MLFKYWLANPVVIFFFHNLVVLQNLVVECTDNCFQMLVVELIDMKVFPLCSVGCFIDSSTNGAYRV